MNAPVHHDDIRKAVVESLSSPSEDIARHVLAMAGANPSQIEKAITTGTGLVAYDLQAPAKNLAVLSEESSVAVSMPPGFDPSPVVHRPRSSRGSLGSYLVRVSWTLARRDAPSRVGFRNFKRNAAIMARPRSSLFSA
jgi:hypothetical protein